jgi:hypothetical protein
VTARTAALAVSCALLLACARDLGKAPDIAWDHVACDGCGMIVSDPRFAAQLVPQDGPVRVFDDPACLFAYVERDAPHIAKLWFHDHRGVDGRWLDEREVAFVAATGTPMAGGLGAVPAGTAGAISFGEASARTLGKAGAR